MEGQQGKNGENAEQVVISIPRGKVLKDFQYICKKHGNLGYASGENSVIAFRADYINSKGEHCKNPNVYCLACLNEYLEKLQKEGHLAPVAIVPITGDPDPKESQDTHSAN